MREVPQRWGVFILQKVMNKRKGKELIAPVAGVPLTFIDDPRGSVEAILSVGGSTEFYVVAYKLPINGDEWVLTYS